VSDGRDLERALVEAEAGQGAGPPPLRPFGLILHRDARWSHEGQPILNRKLRAKFDCSVVYLPDEQKYVVQIGRFRGQIEIEEAGFFVRALDLDAGEIVLSDGSRERLRVESLRPADGDGALLCQIKHELRPGGLPARFLHSPQADFLGAVIDQGGGRLSVVLGREAYPLPEELTRPLVGGD
jgi:hypothetical protein